MLEYVDAMTSIIIKIPMDELTFRSSSHCFTSPGGTTIKVAPDLPSFTFRLARAAFAPLRIKAIVTTVFPLPMASPRTPPRSGDFFEALPIKHQPIPIRKHIKVRRDLHGTHHDD